MKYSLIALLTTSVLAAEGEYDYKKQGADWGDVQVENNKCGDDAFQSPIDLPMNVKRD